MSLLWYKKTVDEKVNITKLAIYKLLTDTTRAGTRPVSLM